MRWLSCTLALLVSALVLGLASPAAAQQPRYMPPAGPTLPNALNYFRRDVGVLDPYNAFVGPRRDLEYQLHSMQAQQQADFRAASSAIQQLRAAEAAPTGVGASFMNYSHYYRMPAAAPAARRR
jgi:hypothetical protein